MARRIDVIRIESGWSRGTGFLIDEERVITALHVVGKVEKERLVFQGADLLLTAAVRDDMSFHFLVCQPSVEDVEFDERLDWACIRVRGALSGAARLSVGELADSDQNALWHTYGFPASSTEDGKATAGTVTSPIAAVSMKGQKLGAIQLFSQEAAAGNGGAVHGYSGAPVIVGERVVGILFAASVDEETGVSQEGTLYALPLSALGIALPTIECPYPGLRSFDAADAARKRFFGRGAEIERVLDRLRSGERQVLVVGPSGSGKSSFVKAGIFPRLPELGIGFDVRSLQPGPRPCERLLQAFHGAETAKEGLRSRLDTLKSGVVLLVIDQLEELFTQCQDRAERQRFAEAYELLHEEPRCVIILAVRADFYGDLIGSALWPYLGGRSYQLELPPLHDRQLVEAIDEPARAAGVSVEAGLREKLVADAASEPGALPLLQVALRTLWEKRRRSSLCLDDYLAMGDGGKSGLAVALEHTADAVLHALSTAQQSIARRIFLRLVTFGEGRAPTRRQQPVDALMSTADDELQALVTLDELTNGKLLTRDIRREGAELIEVVDMAHEALITAWPALAGWIASRHADEQRRRMLEADVKEWIARGRGAGALLDAVQLAEADAWITSDAARDVGYGKDLTDYLDASRRVLDEGNRRRRRLTYAALGVLSVFSIVVSSLANFALNERSNAQHKAQMAKQQETKAKQLLGLTYMDQGRQLVVDALPQQALPFFVAAREQGMDGPLLKMLFASVRPLTRIWFVGHSGPVRGVAISSDGTRVVTASEDKTARIWDARTGKPMTPPLEHRKAVCVVAFSANGMRVATGSEDNTVRIWDAETGTPVTAPLAHSAEEFLGRTGISSGKWINTVRFSPDGRRLLTTSSDHTARIWDAETGTPITLPLGGNPNKERFVHYTSAEAFSPDGTRVVLAAPDGTMRVWDSSTGKPAAPLLRQRDVILSVSFSPDGARLVIASGNAARVWDVKTGTPLTPDLSHMDLVLAASFSPSGEHIVTASRDRTARIWDARTGTPLAPPMEHLDIPFIASFNADGTRVMTASADKAARVWDAKTGKPLTPWLEHQGPVRAASFSADGTYLVTASADGMARLWDTKSMSPVEFDLEGTHIVTTWWDDKARMKGVSVDKDGNYATAASVARTMGLGDTKLIPVRYRETVRAASFSADGTRLLTRTDYTVRIWDASTGKPLAPPIEQQSVMHAASLRADGARVVTAGGDKTARIWDTMTGEALGPPLEHQGTLNSASFSVDGTRIVTASDDHTARVWDATTGKPITPALEHRERVLAASFSADGSRVVTASQDKTARVWDATTGKPLTPPLEHDLKKLGVTKDASFSVDGLRVVTAGGDGTARVWDATTGKPITSIQHDESVGSALFSVDGTRVLTTSRDAARVWDASTGEPLGPPLRHREQVWAASFSPDGTRVVTASADSTVRIWDASTGKPLTPPLEHGYGVNVASFSADGTRIVTAGDHSVRVWSFPMDPGSLEQWQERARCSPYELANGTILPRSPPETCWTK